MPIFEYRCQVCGQLFEELIYRTEEERDLRCPSCGSTQVAKQSSTFAAGRFSGGNSGTSSGPACGGGG